MTHLWQRFLLASSLLAGLAVGVAATVFGYSNLATVDIHWSVFHLDKVPLWTVVVLPVALILVAGTIYHWIDGLHHFTEHMRHRHRVRDLEAEVARLRAHLDQVLEMPRGERTEMPAPAADKPSLPAPKEEVASQAEADAAMDGLELEPKADAAPELEPARGKTSTDRKKRSRIIMEPEPPPETAAAPAVNGVESEPAPIAKEA